MEEVVGQIFSRWSPISQMGFLSWRSRGAPRGRRVAATGFLRPILVGMSHHFSHTLSKQVTRPVQRQENRPQFFMEITWQKNVQPWMHGICGHLFVFTKKWEQVWPLSSLRGKENAFLLDWVCTKRLWNLISKILGARGSAKESRGDKIKTKAKIAPWWGSEKSPRMEKSLEIEKRMQAIRVGHCFNYADLGLEVIISAQSMLWMWQYVW